MKTLCVKAAAAALIILAANVAKAQTWDCGYCAPLYTCTPTNAVTATLSGGTLTIRGTGEMAHFTSPNYAPWYSYSNSITSVVINAGVTSIGNYAFRNCTALTSVSIPSSVTDISGVAFLSCTALTDINVDAASESFSSQDGILFNKDKTTLVLYPAGKTAASYTIPSSVTTIDHYAFVVCESLTSVVIPNGVKNIPNYAFFNCKSLTSISIPSSVTYLSFVAFYPNTPLTAINVDAANPRYSSVDGVLFSKNKDTLYTYPAGKTAKAYTIPASVTTIENIIYLFDDCPYLAAINVDAANANYASVDGALYDKDKKLFYKCPAGKTQLSIPEGVWRLENNHLGYTALTTSVSIPSSAASIYGGAFSRYTSLTTVYNYAAIPYTMGNGDPFSEVTLANVDLYVPAASVAAYRAANIWKDFRSIQAIVAVTGVSLNKTDLSLAVGSSQTLAATIAPATNAANQNVMWSSSDESVATVSEGTITAVRVGTASIKVTTADGGKTAQCAVTVIASPTAVKADTQTSLQVYPNPAGDMLYITDDFVGVVEIYDLAGTIVLTSTSSAINISSLPSGIYVVKAGGRAGKVVKQ